MKHLALPLLVLALLGAGCPFLRTPQPVVTPVPAVKPVQPATIEPMTDTTTNPVEAIQTVSSTYQPFTKTAYDAAKASGKPIFVFFYANWCPTCREQDPRLQNVVPAHMGGVVGFRVNFNDTETDADEKAIAKEFGVTYQHTGFFIGRDGATAQKTIGTITDAKTTEYLNLISK